MLFLVGPSGCGKTTLLSILCGTLKPDAGSVSVLDSTLTELSNRRLTAFRGQHIGFVFQQFNLIQTLTITENVSVPLLISGLSHRKASKPDRAVPARELQRGSFREAPFDLFFY